MKKKPTSSKPQRAAKKKPTSSKPQGAAKKKTGGGCSGATCSARIFSGPESKALWDEINSIDDFATPSQIGMCLYSIGCKLQELEAKSHRLNAD